MTFPSLTLPPTSSLHNQLPTFHLWTSFATLFTLPFPLPLTYFMPTALLPITSSVSIRTWDPSLPQDGLSLAFQPYSFCLPPLPTLQPNWTVILTWVKMKGHLVCNWGSSNSLCFCSYYSPLLIYSPHLPCPMNIYVASKVHLKSAFFVSLSCLLQQDLVLFSSPHVLA